MGEQHVADVIVVESENIDALINLGIGPPVVCSKLNDDGFCSTVRGSSSCSFGCWAKIISFKLDVIRAIQRRGGFTGGCCGCCCWYWGCVGAPKALELDVCNGL